MYVHLALYLLKPYFTNQHVLGAKQASTTFLPSLQSVAGVGSYNKPSWLTQLQSACTHPPSAPQDPPPASHLLLGILNVGAESLDDPGQL